MAVSQILVVDDELGIRELLSEILRDEGFDVLTAENAAEARAARVDARPDLVLLDIWMPDTDGVTLLKEWASTGMLTMPVIMMSGHGTIETAVEATRIGAFDFLEKPIAMQKLLSTIERALKRGSARVQPGISLQGLGRSNAINELRARLEKVLPLRAPVLLMGPPGAPIEACARFLHQPNTAWVAPDNGAALREAPLQLLERAREGMLFLREVAHLSRLEQKGLLLLLGSLERYGVRVVAGASRTLPHLVAEGGFDPLLYRGLAGLTVTVPSLAERREDIPDLARAVLEGLIHAGEVTLRSFSIAALNLLRNVDWPGDVSQLESLVRSVAATALREEIGPEDLEPHLGTLPAAAPEAGALSLDLPLREARDKFEQAYFEYHMALEGGNMSRVAEKTGVERTHLYRKLKQLGVRLPRKGEQ